MPLPTLSKIKVYSCTFTLSYTRKQKQQVTKTGQFNIVVFQLLRLVQLFVTPGSAALQASLSSTISWSLLKFTSVSRQWTVAHELHCPWDRPGKNPGVGRHFLLQGISSAQVSNPYFCVGRQILHH